MGGVEVQIQAHKTSELVGGEWSASRPGRFKIKFRYLNSVQINTDVRFINIRFGGGETNYGAVRSAER
jgi:hypothetical protein